MKYLLLVLIACLLGLAQPTPRQDTDAIEKELRRLEMEWDSKGTDKAAIRALLTEDFVWIPQNGAVVSLDEYLASIGAANRAVSASTPEDMRVRVYGATAVITMKRNIRFQRGSETTDVPVVITDVVVKHGSKWLLANRQATRVAAPQGTR